jgi:hypothetical protein
MDDREEELLSHLHEAMKELDRTEGPIVKDGYPIGGLGGGGRPFYFTVGRYTKADDAEECRTELVGWIVFTLVAIILVGLYLFAP